MVGSLYGSSKYLTPRVNPLPLQKQEEAIKWAEAAHSSLFSRDSHQKRHSPFS